MGKTAIGVRMPASIPIARLVECIIFKCLDKKKEVQDLLCLFKKEVQDLLHFSCVYCRL